MNEFAVQYLVAPFIAATLGFLTLWLQEWRRQRNAESRHQRLLESSAQQSRFFSEWFKVQEGLGLPEPELTRYREEIQQELRTIYAEVQAGCVRQVERKDEPSPLVVTFQRLGRSLRFPRPTGWKLWGLAVLYYVGIAWLLLLLFGAPFVIVDTATKDGAGEASWEVLGLAIDLAVVSILLVGIRRFADRIRSRRSLRPVVATTPDLA